MGRWSITISARHLCNPVTHSLTLHPVLTLRPRQTEYPPLFPAILRMPMLGSVATVFEDPSVDNSDIEVYRTRTQRLVIRGSGFNQAVRPILDFDPPLDSANLHINVRKDGRETLYIRSILGILP